MEILFDPDKDAVNREKHGCSLADAALLDWDNALVADDLRRDYGERRQIALATLSGHVYVAIFVDRPEGRRIVSLRKANRRESTRYG